MLELIFDVIQNNKNEWGFDARDKDFSVIRRTSTWLGDSGKVIYLVFKKGAKIPSVVLKTVRKAESSAGLQQEAKNVFDLWQKNPSLCQDVIPEPLALIDFENLPLYVERAIPGTTLPELVAGKWTLGEKFRALMEGTEFGLTWISKMIEVLGIENRKLGKHQIEEFIKNRLSAFRLLRSTELQWPSAIEEMEEFVSGLEGKTFPLVPSHGDLWGGSLLMGVDQCWHIIDWEFYKPVTMPFFDCFMLAVHPGVAFGTKNFSLSQEFLLCFKDTPHSRKVRNHIERLLKQLDLDPAFLKYLFLFFLMSMSLDRDSSQRKPNWLTCLNFYLNHQNNLMILP